MSTKHTGKIVDTGNIHHATKLPIRKPDASYNKSIGGVDNLSRVIVLFALARKGVKWYRRIAEVFMDFSVFNAYIVWKNLNPDARKSHLEFRQQIVKLIMTYHVHGSSSNFSGRGYSMAPHHNPLRLKEKHFISPIPSPPGRNMKRRKCVRCNALNVRKDTSYQCCPCGVSLCIYPYFEIFHTRLYYDVDSDDVDSDNVDY